MTFEEFAKDYNHYSYNGFECIWSQPKWAYYNLFVKLPLECVNMFSKESIEIIIKGFFHIEDSEQIGYEVLSDCLLIGFKNCYRYNKWVNSEGLIHINAEKLVQLISFENK